MKKIGWAFILILSLLVLPAPGYAAMVDSNRILNLAVAADEPVVADRLLYAAFLRMGYEATFEATGINAALHMADKGEKDGVAALPAETGKYFPDLVRIPESIGKVKYEVYALGNFMPEIESWADLRGLRVATLFHKNNIDGKLPSGVTPVRKQTLFDLVEALERGECDVFVVTNSLVSDIPVPGSIKKIAVPETADSFAFLNIACAELADPAAEALRAMKKDGTFTRITRQDPDPRESSKALLLITSYSPDDTWEKMFREGISGPLQGRNDISCYSVSLHSNRILNDAGRIRSVLDTLRTVFLSNPPSAVVASDLNAIDFLRKYHRVLFSELPVVLCGVSGNLVDNLWEFGNNCVVITDRIPASENVREILDFYPQTKEIFVINDYTETGSEWRREIRSQLEDFAGRIAITHNENSSLKDLATTLAGLKEGTVVLFGHYNVDGERQYYSQQEIQTRTRQNCNVPIFGMMGGSIGYGQVGGKYVNPLLYGETAAKTAVSLIDASHMPEDARSVGTSYILNPYHNLNTWIFDENELRDRFFNYPPLPGGTCIINRKLSLYESNPVFFLMLNVLGILTILVITILSSLIYILRNRNKKLMAMQQNLNNTRERLVREENALAASAAMENELMTARDAAEAANRSKSLFLSSISHEIRTPMNGIIGMSELLLTGQLEEQQKKYVDNIRISATSLLVLINDILDFSKINDGKFRLEPSNFDLRELLENLQAMFMVSTTEKGIEFRFEVDEGLPQFLFGDDVRLRQILINLIGNSVKFTGKGYVRLGVFARGDRLRCEVEDTGAGIKKKYLSRIFNSFEQFDRDKNRKFGGTGLGLFITKNLVDLMQGEIGVTSRYGRGSLFYFEIPLVPGVRESAPAESETPFVTAPGTRALVVDDNAINLDVAVGMLRLHKIECDQVLSGTEALEKIKTTKYDLIFMDHMMPDMDGIETTARIRRNEYAEEKNIIIALTANAIRGVRNMFIEAGMDDYLAKPIQENSLNAILRQWLPAEKIIEDASPYGNAGTLQESALLDRLKELEELDPAFALGRINNMAEAYIQSVGITTRRLPEIIRDLNEHLQQRELKKLAIALHGIRGALGNIGAMELADRAGILERYSKNDEIDFCSSHMPLFLEELRRLHRKLQNVLSEKDETTKPTQQGSVEILRQRLEAMKPLLENFEDDEVLQEIEALQKFDYGPDINPRMKELMNLVFELRYDDAVRVIDTMFSSRDLVAEFLNEGALHRFDRLND